MVRRCPVSTDHLPLHRNRVHRPQQRAHHGELTLHGITKPITLETIFNGGYAGHQYEPRARIGFSAHGAFKRSDFGIAYGIPEPGSNMGVFDDVEVIIEAEFTGPVPAAP